MRRRSSGGLALVELLVVIVLLAVLAGVYFAWFSPRRAREMKAAVEGGSGGTAAAAARTPLGKALEKGRSMECLNNLSQLRQAIQIYVADNGTYPPDLRALNLPNMTRCPVTGQAYVYDPGTGTVRCPAHPKY